MTSQIKNAPAFLNVKVVFAAAVVLRITLFLLSCPWRDDWIQRLTYIGDPFEYTVLGRSLLTRGEFSLTWPVPMPNALRLPVYPLFIAITSGGALDMLWLTVLCQVLIDSLFAVFLTRCIGVLFRSGLMGRIAGLLYACSPDAALWSTQLLAESISMWLIVGALYGLAAAGGLAEGRGRGRFATGVICAALLPLCKPVWQYLWLLLLAWVVFRAACTRILRPAGWLVAAALAIAAPGVAWMKRNHDAWGIFTLSVSKPYVQKVSAGGILLWAKADTAVFDYTREMALHFLSPDFTRLDAMPPEFMNVTSWDRNALAKDYRNGEELHSLVLHRHWPVYLRQHLIGSAYLLFSPGTNYLRRFVGANPLTEENFGFIGHADLGTSDKFLGFVRRGLAQPGAIIWTVVMVVFLILYYVAVLGGIRRYWREFRWNIWTLFLVGAGSFVFLIGPVGSSRYRFVLIQAFLPMACFGILKWLGRRPEHTAGDGARQDH